MINYDSLIVNKDGIEVDKKNITCSSKMQVRCVLKIPILNSIKKSKKALVVMMNPSKADKNESDLTVNKIIKFLSKNKFASVVTICNLFPFYESESTDLGSLISPNKEYKNFENQLKKNRREINKQVKDADVIILAYGDCPGGLSIKIHRKEVAELFNNLLNKNNIYVFGYEGLESFHTVDNNPYHPSKKGNIISKKRAKAEFHVSVT